MNRKYGLSVAREFTIGRAIKKSGETDLYIYKESGGIITDYAILENKYIENFTEQYNQLMGYLNPHFKNELKTIDGDFVPIILLPIFFKRGGGRYPEDEMLEQFM